MIAAAVLLSTLAQAPMTFTTIQQGPLSGVEAERRLVVRTDAEWQTLWREHQPGSETPRVDFSRSMVIAVFMGSRRTAGYGIEVTRVQRDTDGLTVFYRQTAPDPEAMTAQVITAPFHIVRTENAPGSVTFRADAGR